jgi:hypothetical protein
MMWQDHRHCSFVPTCQHLKATNQANKCYAWKLEQLKQTNLTRDLKKGLVGHCPPVVWQLTFAATP